MGRFLVKTQKLHYINIKYFKLRKLFCSLISFFVYFAGYLVLYILIIGINNAFCLYSIFETQLTIIVYSEHEWTKIFTLLSASVEMQSGYKYMFA